MKRPNIVSVSWSDHLVFGKGDGLLNTIQALRRRMHKWRKELKAATIHWRCTRDRIKGRYYEGRGHQHFFKVGKAAVDWNDFEVVPEIARQLGMRVFLYVALFDEGWPLLLKKDREVSYHNRMHCQHTSWQSEFSRKNPRYTVVDRTLQHYQWGVLCLAYPEVRAHMIRRYLRLIDSGNFDGLFVCLRSQSRPADFADQFGFNAPVRDEHLHRYGNDIWKEDFEIQNWRDLHGEYLTLFLHELHREVRDRQLLLSVGIPQGDILGPPLGNTKLEWRKWICEGIVDQLVIGQNSSKCPSMWHELWPMHRGYGYLQNYLNGHNLAPLLDDLRHQYLLAANRRHAKLFVARQWHARSQKQEDELMKLSGVAGLVFSSFRHDNSVAVQRNEWTV